MPVAAPLFSTCAQKGGSNRRLQRTAQWGASWFIRFTEYYPDKQIKGDKAHGAYGTNTK
jgi:hypothetical protein